MRRSTVLWILALVVTLAAAVYQEITGPTYPVRDRVALGDQRIPIKLQRSWSTGDQPVEVPAPADVQGRVRWRRYPSADAWRVQDMERSSDVLRTSLPHQPPAGKLEYQVELARAGARVVVPGRPAVTRFKGEVSPAILAPHVLAMFLGMLFSTRAGLEAIIRGQSQRSLAAVATVLLLVGGFVFGPLVQKAAFGAYWTGVPWGYDLTDNKTLIALAVWLIALWRVNVRPSARWSVLAAAIVTLAVFVIPHSVWGSEMKWQ